MVVMLAVSVDNHGETGIEGLFHDIFTLKSDRKIKGMYFNHGQTNDVTLLRCQDTSIDEYDGIISQLLLDSRVLLYTIYPRLGRC